jgi:restriction system protein
LKSYYRIMLGRKSLHAEECYNSNVIGAGFIDDLDLTNKLPDNWRDFNKKIIPVYLEKYPEKSKVAAGLACGALHTVCKGIKNGDIVLCPNGSGSYHVGEVIGDYNYQPGNPLPHRRPVRWYPKTIDKSVMSEAMQNSVCSMGTVSNITKYAEDIERLLDGNSLPPIQPIDPTIEDPVVFALEKHLEDFLVKNWKNTELGKKYNIFKDDGELVGQQFQCDTGQIDILAVSKDNKELLVIELKRGRASDVVVGQIQRYMGYVLEELAEKNQTVKGVIIALEDDLRLRRALAVTTNIQFYRYEVRFKLFKD